jgi:kynurenine 3-monooxygenase
MVPFYGQGMNAGLEDVRVLFSILDKHIPASSAISMDKAILAQHREAALAEYSDFRTPDAYAINDLALGNYTEMRASVVSPIYRLRKWMEEQMSVHFPTFGWKTKYSRVSFENERYSEVVRQSERQGRLLVMGFVGVLTGSTLTGGLLAWSRWRRHGAGVGLFGR